MEPTTSPRVISPQTQGLCTMWCRTPPTTLSMSHLSSSHSITETGRVWSMQSETLERSKNDWYLTIFWQSIFNVRLGREIQVYTGTHGTLKYKDTNNNYQKIFLHQGYIPAPRYYWKVLQDQVSENHYHLRVLDWWMVYRPQTQLLSSLVWMIPTSPQLLQSSALTSKDQIWQEIFYFPHFSSM